MRGDLAISLKQQHQQLRSDRDDNNGEDDVMSFAGSVRTENESVVRGGGGGLPNNVCRANDNQSPNGDGGT